MADAPDVQVEDLSPMLQGILQPISDDNPVGADVTYEDSFTQLKAEIDKISAVSVDGGVDFERVVELGTKVLSEQSKDLRAAIFLTMGLQKTRGFEGFAEGVAAVDLLTRTYWEDMYPPLRRIRGRKNALQSLSDRLKEWIADDQPVAEDVEHLERALEHLKALQSFTMETMEENAPALSGLSQAIERAQRRAPKPEPEAEPEEPSSRETETASPQAPQQEQRAPSTSSRPSGTADPSAGLDSEKDAKNAVLKIADFLLEQNDASPEAYRLVRMMRWSNLQQEPPNEGGQTLLPPPESHRINFLENLASQNKHAQLVQQAEQSFRNTALWLDLQRYAATGLGAMGMNYAAAQEAVLFETALLLKRVPRLPSLTFNDGTPLANAATKAWVEMQVQPMLEGNGGGGSSGGGDSSHLAEQYDQARQHLGNGDLPGALEAMRNGQRQDASQKDRFIRRLYIATLCVKGGQPAVARPVLERLGEEVDTHGLEAWDPPLALEVWTNLHRCYTTLAAAAKGDEAEHYHGQARRVFDRLCQLDASHALSVFET